MLQARHVLETGVKLISQVTGAIVVIFGSSINVHAQLKVQADEGINMMITKSSVLIATPSGHGSGTVIGLLNGKLIIVTARHATEGTAKGEDVYIHNKEGEMIGTAKGSDIRKSVDTDMAIIFARRTSTTCIVPATLGKPSLAALSKLEQGSKITVAGYASTDAGLTRKPILRISSGSVTSILSESEAANGYQFSYNAVTARGMSGGGVFTWRKGLVLIGTHGMGERDDIRDFDKTGFNYAIPADKAYGLLGASLGNQLAKSQLGNIYIDSGNISKAIATVCTEPFSQWYCTVSGNNQTGANDQVCYVGSGELKQRRRIIVQKGRCGFGSHPLCGLVLGYE